MSNGQYSISKVEYPLLGGLAAHNYLAVFDPAGNVIHEFHGLATDKNGNPKPIGYLPSDRLKYWHVKESWYYKGTIEQTNEIPKSRELFSGSYKEVKEKVEIFDEVGNYLNSLDLHYPFLGVGLMPPLMGKNSNAFETTLQTAAGLNTNCEDMNCSIPGGAWFAPSEGELLVEQSILDSLALQASAQYWNNLNNDIDGISYLDGYDTSFGSGYYQSKYDGLLPTINVDMTLPATDLNPWGNIDFNQYENFLGEPYAEKIDLSIPVDNFSGSLIGENSVDIDTADFFTPDEIDAFTGVGIEIDNALGVSLSGSLNDFTDIDDGDFMTADSIDHWLDTFDDISDTVVANTDDFGNIIGLVSDNPQSLFVDFDEPTSFNIYDDLADLTDNWDSGVDSSISAVDHSIWNTSDWNTSGWINDFADSSLDSTSLLDSFHTDFGTAYWDNSFSNFDDGFDYGLTDYGYSLDSFDNFDYSFDSFDYGMDSFDTFSTVDSFSYEPSIDFSPSFDFDFGGGSFW